MRARKKQTCDALWPALDGTLGEMQNTTITYPPRPANKRYRRVHFKHGLWASDSATNSHSTSAHASSTSRARRRQHHESTHALVKRRQLSTAEMFAIISKQMCVRDALTQAMPLHTCRMLQVDCFWVAWGKHDTRRETARCAQPEHIHIPSSALRPL